MRAIERLLFRATLCLSCAAFAASHAVAKDAAANEAAVHEAVSAVMREYKVPGIAIAVTENGRHTFYNFGVASRATGRKVASDTLFEIGSISKTFTATLATYSQAQGRLSLADSPARFFPELRGSELDKVTLLQLGTHTAGGFPLQVPNEIATREQLMAYFEAWRPTYTPGTARTYANPSIGLLGMVAARSMGTTFTTAMEGQLFPKLGMHDSYIDVPVDRTTRYAQGYDKANLPVRVNPGVIAAEAYGVKTTAEDLIHFVDIQLNPSQLEAPVARAVLDTRTGCFTLGAMTQDLVWEQYDEPVALQSLLEGNSDKVSSGTHPVAALDPPRPASAEVWVNKTGSTNGFGAYVAFRPARHTGIVILANKNLPIAARVRLAYSILGALNGNQRN